MLTSYVDNEVTADERLTVEDHLERCHACSVRVSRERAVRQRLRRWSAEARVGGAPLDWPAGFDTTLPRSESGRLRMAALSAAAIAIVLMTWGRWGSDDGVPLAARGQIGDSRCAGGHTHAAPELRNVSGRDCVRRCVEMGAEYVFVSQGVVYTIRNQALVDLTRLAGQDVEIEGEVRQNLLTVSSVRPAAVSRSNHEGFSQHVRVSAGQARRLGRRPRDEKKRRRSACGLRI
jgi:hypothetical protein